VLCRSPPAQHATAAFAERMIPARGYRNTDTSNLKPLRGRQLDLMPVTAVPATWLKAYKTRIRSG
jgi:hypothetical protein